MDSSIILALRSALENEPENLSLREHLCEVLFRGEAWSDTLFECEQLLRLSPKNKSALGYASAAALSLGQPELAARYELAGDQLSQDLEPTNAEPAQCQEHSSPTEPKILLRDVAGLRDVKQRLNHAFFDVSRNPEAASAYGKKIAGGMLLYGPPGCGKTFLARALAGELGAAFVPASIGQILNLFVGESEKNLSSRFEHARRLAPSVLFFDEFDAIGRKRTAYTVAGTRELISVLLEELDGAVMRNTGVFVVAATNHPWDLDVALTRPGRIDRGIFVPLPDQEARTAILTQNMAGKPATALDFESLAGMTKLYSGADLKALCERASEFAMADAISTGKLAPVCMDHFRNALKNVRPSTKPWFEMARNYALFANSSGQWNELLDYMRSERLL